MWFPGYKEIYGNEATNILAKEGVDLGYIILEPFSGAQASFLNSELKKNLLS